MSRVALIAGASGGIGGAIASSLEASGYSVACMSRSVTEGVSGAVFSVQCDVTSRESVFHAVEKVITHYGRIDLFVNSVGIAQAETVENLTEEDLLHLFSTNVTGALWLYQAVSACMKKQRSGYIIHIGSLRADVPGIEKAGYCATKAAATELCNVLAKELKEYGIRVTTIHPGYVNTQLYKGVSQNVPFRGEVKKGEVDVQYLADALEPEDLGKMVLCLDSLSETACVDTIRMGRIWGR